MHASGGASSQARRRLRTAAAHVVGTGRARVSSSHDASPPHLLSEVQLRSFHDDGFVVVRDLFAPEELQPFRDIVATWLGEVGTELVEMGALSSTFAELDIEARLARMEAEVPGCALQMQNAFMRDRKLGDMSVWSLPELRALRSDPRLLDILEQLVGAEIAAHPNAVLRCRTPTPVHGADGGRVPWHQDAGYLLGDAVKTTVLGVWMPLCDVTPALDNGCLQCMPSNSRNSHHVLQHYQAPSYLVVDPAEFEQHFDKKTPVTCDVPAGSLVLFNSFTAHRSLPNSSDKARFSFDLRYQDARLPHGMGKNGGLVQLRSASPAFEVDWQEGPLGPPLPVGDDGELLPQWPTVGPEFTYETYDQLGEQPRRATQLGQLKSAQRGGVLAAVQNQKQKQKKEKEKKKTTQATT
jgi:phytanoyl-CoA hydroxylase